MVFIFLITILYPLVISATVIHYGPSATLYTHAIPISSHQYLSQDTLGQYSYGYTGDGSSKSELKLLDGITRGSYSYVDANGKIQTVKYVADDLNGFRVAATNLPVHRVEELQPIQDTEEVRKAKEEHFAALREAEIKAAEQPDDTLVDDCINIENENGNEHLSENVNNNDIPSQNNENGGNIPLLLSDRELNLKNNGFNYQTSYVHVTTPQNSYAYSVYDYPNSGYLSDGYVRTYADTFGNYHQPILVSYNSLNGKNNNNELLLNNPGYERASYAY